MDAARPDVSDHRCHAWGELILDIQVPLAHVIAMGVRIGVSGAQFVGWKGAGQPIEEAYRISRGVFEHRVLEERRRLGHQQNVLIGQRQHVKQTNAAADSQLAVAERIPGKSDPRFKILCGWVAFKQRITQMGSAGGQISQNRELPVGLGKHAGHFIAEAEIQSQIRFPAPVVLNISAKDVLAEIAGCERAGNSALKLARRVGQKMLQVAEEPDSVGIG